MFMLSPPGNTVPPHTVQSLGSCKPLRYPVPPGLPAPCKHLPFCTGQKGWDWGQGGRACDAEGFKLSLLSFPAPFLLGIVAFFFCEKQNSDLKPNAFFLSLRRELHEWGPDRLWAEDSC